MSLMQHRSRAPYRGRTATEISLLAEAARRDLTERCRLMSLESGRLLARLVLEPTLAEEALISGAMPGEFSPRELVFHVQWTFSFP